MKRVYFVRHGESVSNVSDIVQGLHDALTPEGERQARIVAERVKNLKIDALIASDAVRAQSTAQAISDETGWLIDTSPLFREIKNPTSFVGMQRTNEAYLNFQKAQREHSSDPAYRFEDEENYADRKERAEKALAYVMEHEGEDLMVVTHGHFLRFMLMMMVMEGKANAEIWESFAKGFAITNTAITVAVHNGERWRILTWNDHAHFAE